MNITTCVDLVSDYTVRTEGLFFIQMRFACLASSHLVKSLQLLFCSHQFTASFD